MAMRLHGASRTKLYKCWLWMRKRCRDRTNPKNYRYAGRGIKVCDEWEQSFEAFRDWALANGYQEGLTIDRIDNDGNYEPNNCRWVTRKIQNNNRSDNNVITYKGKTQTLREWCDELGLIYHRIYDRIYRCHWPIEEAFTHKKYERGNKNEKEKAI